MMNPEIEIREVPLMWENRRVYGQLYTPKDPAGPLPAVILCHGYGGDARGLEGDARYFAGEGFAAYAFDFSGGGLGSRSDGSPSEMSVLTEAAQLSAVMYAVRALPGIDPDNLFLWGASQGGFVASLAASEHPSDVRALVCLFPAYVIQDDTRRRVPDPEHIPEKMDVMGMTLGAVYHRDALSFDVYEKISRYPRPVLILHGEADTLVPIAYSERAIEAFPDARLIPVPGAGHGFGGADWLLASSSAARFFKANLRTADSEENKGGRA